MSYLVVHLAQIYSFVILCPEMGSATFCKLKFCHILQLAVDEFLAIPSCVLLPEDVPQSTQYNKEDEQLLDKEIEQLEMRAKRVCSISYKLSSARISSLILLLLTIDVYLGEIAVLTFVKFMQTLCLNLFAVLRVMRERCHQGYENITYLAL